MIGTKLPASYTTLHPFVLKSKDIFAPSIPESNNNAIPLYTNVDSGVCAAALPWLDHVKKLFAHRCIE